MFVSEGGEGVQVRNERCSFQGRQKTFATTPLITVFTSATGSFLSQEVDCELAFMDGLLL